VSTGTKSDNKTPNPIAINDDFQDKGFHPIVLKGKVSIFRMKPSITKPNPQYMASPTKVENGSLILGWIKTGLMNKAKTVGIPRDKLNPTIVFFILI
jgi:hypothetical protein